MVFGVAESHTWGMMATGPELIANFMSGDEPVAAWARRREEEGWPVLGCADHLWSGDRAFPHVWVTLATMAAATQKCLLTSSFANNLFRSPVEFAQASLQMQQVSGGRFEAGLGAGWSEDEAVGGGFGYPSPGVRARRYAEAIHIVKALLAYQRVEFDGDHYTVSVPRLGPAPTRDWPPPPLVASLGGDYTIRTIAPLVDRVELKLISAATRAGSLDVAAMAQIPSSHLDDLIAKVRVVNPAVPLGVFLLCSVGDDARTRAMEKALAGSFLGGFFGSPDKVADSIRALRTRGISRAQISPFTEASFELLAERF